MTVHCTTLLTSGLLLRNGHGFDRTPGDMLRSIDVSTWDLVAQLGADVDAICETAFAAGLGAAWINVPGDGEEGED